MNKAIVIIQLAGNTGGAQKRIINLFNYLSRSHNDYFLIINRNLFNSIYSKENLSNEIIDKIYILDIDKGYSKNTGLMKSSRIPTSKAKRYINSKLIKRFKHLIYMILLWLRFIIKVVPILKINNINYIYTTWLGGMWLWPLKYIMNFRLIYNYMDSGYSSLSRSIFDILNSERWVLKHADIIDFLSVDLCNHILKCVHLKKSVKLSICPNSFIDYTKFYPIYPKDNLIVFLARLEKIKNPMLFLESLNKIKNKLNNYQVYILGEGLLEDSIRDYILSHNLTNVLFIGQTFSPWEYLKKSKIFVSIQENNNYPSQSLIEAMACENAIIASDVGETRRIVSDKEGVLVKLDASLIANAILYLVENNNVCISLGKNARKLVLSNHTIEKYANYFFSLETL